MKKFYKSMAMLLALIMLFSLVGCQKAAPASSSSLFKPGTYTGEADGIHGKVQVEVTVDENKITEVKIVKHAETPGVSDLAFENVPADIVKYQTLAVDTVAGASVTSNAIIAAVTQALEKAGAKIEDLQKKPEKSTAKGQTIEKQADVIIIGAGGAGLAAAVTAHQKGATVVVSFYNCFKSKNGILDEVFKKIDDYYLNTVADKLKVGCSHDRIVLFFEIYADYNIDRGIDFVKQLYGVQNNLFITKGRYLQTALQDIIREGQVAGELSTEMTPDEIAEFMFIAIRGVVYHWCLHNGSFDLIEYVSNYTKRMLKAIVI